MPVKLPYLCSAMLACLLPLSVQAQSYPNKPVRMIAPYPPGGTSDVMARLVAQKLSDTIGRQIIVDNRPGATGMIGDPGGKSAERNLLTREQLSHNVARRREVLRRSPLWSAFEATGSTERTRRPIPRNIRAQRL